MTAYDARAVKLRLLTVVAVALVAFYAGVIVHSARTTSDAIVVPKVAPVTLTVPDNARVVVADTYTVSESHSDPVRTAAAIGAAAGALFLLGRLVVIVVRRGRTARQT
jgi:hypothetical protein